MFCHFRTQPFQQVTYYGKWLKGYKEEDREIVNTRGPTDSYPDIDVTKYESGVRIYFVKFYQINVILPDIECLDCL